MNTDVYDLTEILLKSRGLSRGELLIAVKAWEIKFRNELEQLQKTRFHRGNHYRKGNTREEAWAEQWCINLIDEILRKEGRK